MSLPNRPKGTGRPGIRRPGRGRPAPTDCVRPSAGNAPGSARSRRGANEAGPMTALADHRYAFPDKVRTSRGTTPRDCRACRVAPRDWVERTIPASSPRGKPRGYCNSPGPGRAYRRTNKPSSSRLGTPTPTRLPSADGKSPSMSFSRPPVHSENAIVTDLLILMRPQCWRIVSAESSALLPRGKYNCDAFNRAGAQRPFLRRSSRPTRFSGPTGVITLLSRFPITRDGFEGR
jgi:hypothetical protein